MAPLAAPSVSATDWCFVVFWEAVCCSCAPGFYSGTNWCTTSSWIFHSLSFAASSGACMTNTSRCFLWRTCSASASPSSICTRCWWKRLSQTLPTAWVSDSMKSDVRTSSTPTLLLVMRSHAAGLRLSTAGCSARLALAKKINGGLCTCTLRSHDWLQLTLCGVAVKHIWLIENMIIHTPLMISVETHSWILYTFYELCRRLKCSTKQRM